MSDGSAKEAADERTVEVVMVANPDVTDRFAGAFQHLVRIRELRSPVEAEVYVRAVSDDMAETVLERFSRK